MVSGGAKGVDSIAQREAISCGSSAVAYLSDGMMRYMKSSAVVLVSQFLALLVIKTLQLFIFVRYGRLFGRLFCG